MPNHDDNRPGEDLPALSERDAGVVPRLFGHSMTLDEIAKVYDLSPDRIRQIKSNLMCKLRRTG